MYGGCVRMHTCAPHACRRVLQELTQTLFPPSSPPPPAPAAHCLRAVLMCVPVFDSHPCAQVANSQARWSRVLSMNRTGTPAPTPLWGR
jgi:hypothetical protein